MKIKTVHLNHFHNNQHFQFHTEVKDLVEMDNAVQVKISKLFQTYLVCYNNEDEALKKIIKSSITEEIDKADKLRDKTFRGMADAVKAQLNHFDERVCAAAKRVKIVLGTYGNVNILPLNEETSAIYNMLQEFRGDYAQDAELIGIMEWVDELDKKNKDFENLVKSRNDETASKTELKMKTCRKEIDMAYHAIVERINAMIIVEGVSIYEAFVRKLNAFIDKYNN